MANYPKKKLSVIKDRLVKSCNEIYADLPDTIVYQHAILCHTQFPYRNPGDDVRIWERRQGRAVLRVHAGEAINPQTENFVELGLPHGTKSRLILTHLNSMAIKTQSPVIEVDRSLTGFVRRLKLSASGRDIRSVKDHLARLSSANIVIGFLGDNGHAVQVNSHIVKAFDIWFPKEPNQMVLWPSTVHLSDDYFNSLMAHAVPLDERAIASLSHTAMGLDIYCWLAQRLHRIPGNKPQFITWAAIKDQFGFSYSRMDNFKRVFRDTLKTVHTQYLNANIAYDHRGLTLRQSPPPVLSKTVFSITGHKLK